ncbi:hypothetical protein B0H13DRAFT_2653771 [Mycena leptocephala]|nr:hypothetical protein B0H13DRAFT_2653771 [Mycena leptocephala]
MKMAAFRRPNYLCSPKLSPVIALVVSPYLQPFNNHDGYIVDFVEEVRCGFRLAIPAAEEAHLQRLHQSYRVVANTWVSSTTQNIPLVNLLWAFDCESDIDADGTHLIAADILVYVSHVPRV